MLEKPVQKVKNLPKHQQKILLGLPILLILFSIILSGLYFLKQRDIKDSDSEEETIKWERLDFSYTSLDDTYSKDNTSVYWNKLLIENADPSTFEVVQKDIGKDSENYFYKTKRLGALDQQTLRVLENTQDYILDKDHVFFQGIIINNADPLTFRFLYKDRDSYAIDKNAIYSNEMQTYSDELFELVSKKDVKQLQNSTFFINKDFVYSTTQILPLVDPESFELIFGNYGKELDAIYFKETYIPTADSKSFIPISNNYALDDFQYYRHNTPTEELNISQICNDSPRTEILAEHGIYCFGENYYYSNGALSFVDSSYPGNKNLVTENDSLISFNDNDISIDSFFIYSHSNFASDGQNIFYRGNVINEVIIESFIPYSAPYIRNHAFDGKNYFDGKKISDGSDIKRFADPNGLRSLNRFLKDDYRVYYADRNNIIKPLDADPVSFQFLSQFNNHSYAKDKNNIYDKNIKLTQYEKFDVETFEFIGTKYQKDTNRVYYNFIEVMDADPNTFELISHENDLSKDENSVFYKTTKLDTYTPENFNIDEFLKTKHENL